MAASTRYDDFDTFMVDVLETARKCSTLACRYHMRDQSTLYHVSQIVGRGFWLLVAVGTLVALGQAGLLLALPAFLATPPGWALLALLGGILLTVLVKLHRDRRIVAAVVEVGRRVKPRWEALRGAGAPHAQVDALYREAVVMLLLSPAVFDGSPDAWTAEAVDTVFRAQTQVPP